MLSSVKSLERFIHKLSADFTFRYIVINFPAHLLRYETSDPNKYQQPFHQSPRTRNVRNACFQLQKKHRLLGKEGEYLVWSICSLLHLKHPDWDIALVFFTRSLYDLMIGLLDQWIRRFSSDELHYDPKTNLKLRVLHAWGAKEQLGIRNDLRFTRQKAWDSCRTTH